MGIDVLVSVVAASGTLLAGVAVSSQVLQRLVRQLLGVQEKREKPYGKRLAELSASLTKASREVDTVLDELSEIARGREAAVEVLHTNLATLEGREKDLKEKIEALEKTPLPVAEHFAKLLEVREKRNVKRDYALFGSGVVVTTVVAIVIQVLAG